MYGKVRTDVREIIKILCRYKKAEIIEGAVCVDHVHFVLRKHTAPNSNKGTVGDVIGRHMQNQYLLFRWAPLIPKVYRFCISGAPLPVSLAVVVVRF